MPEPEVPVEEEPAASGCDPDYTPCVPISVADLGCADIGFSLTIIGSDPHGFHSNDNDGYGCESFGYYTQQRPGSFSGPLAVPAAGRMWRATMEGRKVPIFKCAGM